MKKIGIITLHGYNNYGNNLQNYALVYIVEKLGYNVSTVIIKEKKINILTSKLKYISKLNRGEILKSFKSKINQDNDRISDEKKIIANNRLNKFKQFSEKYLKETFYDLNNSDDMETISDFSYFISGSDQVWNPIQYQALPIYFLTFASKDKRVSYAPSIGRSYIPRKYKKDYRRWLEGMSSISVRETEGAKIIKDLISKDVPVLVDPTMLLTKEDWLSVSDRASNRPDTPYILTYFLGGPSDNTRKRLQRLAKEKNMKIINLGDSTDRETYQTGPSEFLDYINHASAFFTDSFHGVVFSIIFQTPFIVFERQTTGPSMYSRIETILDNFDMKDRAAKGFDKDIFYVDFSGAEEVLEREYSKSINYLTESLRIEE